MGSLASRLAHDLRTPLSVIKLTVDLLQLQNKDLDEKTLQKITRIGISVDKMMSQIGGVMDFVRTKPLEVQSTTIQNILKSALDGTKIPPDVSINLPPYDIEIRCDTKKLDLVFTNIISNAIQAMENAGTINIRLTDKIDHLLIEIENSGPPIPEEHLEKIFEPLFTTKPAGTGLGLVTCKTIVEQHGGSISAYNYPTRFLIKLPKHATSEIRDSSANSDA